LIGQTGKKAPFPSPLFFLTISQLWKMKRLIVTDRGGIRNKRKSSGISVLVDSFRLGRKKANRNGKKKNK
jgi:hypothetical protein